MREDGGRIAERDQRILADTVRRVADTPERQDTR
jgi:hypothetical protein